MPTVSKTNENERFKEIYESKLDSVYHCPGRRFHDLGELDSYFKYESILATITKDSCIKYKFSLRIYETRMLQSILLQSILS